jgi:hypothetical protein
MRRRSFFTLGIFSSLATLALGAGLTACEDGPNQTFSPAPPSAGNFWNNGDVDGSAGTGTTPLDGSPGTNITPLNLCSADLQRAKWAEMLKQPILPGTPYLQTGKDALDFPLYNNVWNTGLGHASFAGMDMDSNDWAGINIEGAEALLCSSIPIGSSSDGLTPTELVCFGDACEVEFEYVPSTHVVGQVILNLGYTGAADFYSDPKSMLDPPGTGGGMAEHIPGFTDSAHLSNHYHIVIGQQIQKNNQPFEINWNDPKIATLMMIFNAQMYYYGTDQGVYFGKDDSCLFYPPADAPSNGNQCIFGVRPLLTYWEEQCATGLQPGVSTISGIYFDFGKVMPFSHMAQVLKIDNLGPYTHPRPPPIVTDPPNCNQYIGLDFGTFLANCGHVNTATGMETGIIANPAKDVYFAKLTGGHTHDVQSVIFNVIGINMSWDDEQLNVVGPGAQGIVQDSYLPCTGSASNPTAGDPSCVGNPDLATDWEFDVRTDAISDNDNSAIQGTTQRGTGLMQREWANLVQNDMIAILTANPVPGVNPSLYANHLNAFTTGDASCRVPPAQAQALGCTGFEGFAIAGSPDSTDTCPGSPICDNFAAGGYAELLYGGYGSSALAPGDPTSYFCQDPSLASSDLGNCIDAAVWVNALQFVTNVAGGGNPATLPWQLKDRRYFFRWWGIAMIKYYMAYGANQIPFGTTGYLSWLDVDNQNLDLTSLFFDNNFGASFDKDEYIIRGNALPGGIAVQQATPITAATPASPITSVTVPATVAGGLLLGPAAIPMDYNYGSDTLAANQRYTDWYKRMDREEAAMFRAMLVDKTDLYGSENDVNITNLAGSPLLAANYGSYECATQWPTVEIPGSGPNAGSVVPAGTPWTEACQTACPTLATIPGSCPFPPGVMVNLAPAGQAPNLSPTGIPTGDQNGTPATQGYPAAGTNPAFDPPIPYPAVAQVNALAGGLVTPQVRLAAYPAVWGGTGAFCVGSGDTEEGDSYSTGSAGNPFQGTACGGTYSMTASQHGSVFKTASTDVNNARIQFLTTGGTAMPGVPTGTLETLQAFINIPNMANPFNSNTHVGGTGFSAAGNGAAPLKGADSINVAVPWSPSVENVGFSIPISGTTSKFVQTAQLDFTGVLETYTVDYEPWTDPTTGAMDGTIKIDAIEGNDFLGEAFLCQDLGTYGSASGDFIGTQDLLGVHMYDSGGQVLVWLTDHPGLQDTCNVIVQYSEYDNYLNYIASLSAGVAVGISQGSGYGRIVSITIFDPQIAQIP